jgi:hypothetical protein
VLEHEYDDQVLWEWVEVDAFDSDYIYDYYYGVEEDVVLEDSDSFLE